MDIDKINTFNGGHSMFTGTDADVYRMRALLLPLCVQQVEAAMRSTPDLYRGVSPDQLPNIKDSMLFWTHYSGIQKASALSVKHDDDDPQNITKWYLSGVLDEIERRKTASRAPAEPPTTDPERQKVEKINSIVQSMIHPLQDYTRQQMREKMDLDLNEGGLIDELLPTLAHMAAVGMMQSTLQEVDQEQVSEAYDRMTKLVVDKFISNPPRKDVRSLEGYLARNIMKLSNNKHIMSLLREDQRHIIQSIQSQDNE